MSLHQTNEKEESILICRFSDSSSKGFAVQSSDSKVSEKSAPLNDLEANISLKKRVLHLKMVFDQTLITQEVVEHQYKGNGTVLEPFVIEFLPNDERNPVLFRECVKWGITFIVSIEALAVAFVSSAYTGGIEQIKEDFHTTLVVDTLGISLFVLGFALGPLLWGPLSELYGRQALYIGTYMALTVFCAAAAGAQNITTLLAMRFLAGSFGASPLTNSGGIISDMFTSAKRGYAVCFFAVGPYLGPALGPIVGGCLGEAAGWRWIEGSMAMFTGVIWIIGSLVVPETYGPLILRRRAAKLSKLTGKKYTSILEINQDPKTIVREIKLALTRPWVLLFGDPIVFVASIYMAIVYGTLYMTFAAFPIVYQEQRHWSLSTGSLPFAGLAFGIIVALAYLFRDNARYVRALKKSGCIVLPEARLPPMMVGGVCLPISLFWFAWTNAPTVHWSVSVVGVAVFGFGMTLVFLATVGYLIDTYIIYAASVLAASAVLRSLFGAAFPLFTTDMYHELGIHWASSIPAFLALMCVPFPFLLYKFGLDIRMKCKYAATAVKMLEQLQRCCTHAEEQVEAPSAKEESQV